MTGKTHAAAGITASAAFIYTGQLGIEDALVCLSVCTVAALLPDIDEPNSSAGREAGAFSRLVKRVFGHRGLLHTPEFWAACIWLLFHTGMSHAICMYLTAGVATHLALDSLTRGGIPFLVLGCRKIHLAAMRESHMGENLIFAVAHGLTVVLLALRLFGR